MFFPAISVLDATDQGLGEWGLLFGMVYAGRGCGERGSTVMGSHCCVAPLGL